MDIEKKKKYGAVQVLTQTGYAYQSREINGREYLQVPVVMLVEGVHSGSAGPILHLADNFSRNPEDWNGVPLTSDHPHDGRSYVSVNAVPAEEWVVGFLDNCRVEDSKLKGDAFVDVQKALVVNAEITNYIIESKKLEVSTGAVTRDIQSNGEFEGEQYNSITLEYVPDHLALLPGGEGACNWDDGCGIRVNHKTEDVNVQQTKEQIKANRRKGVDVLNGIQTNALGFMQMSSIVQNKLDRLDNQYSTHFLEEIYDDHIICKVVNYDDGTRKYYRQSYEVEGEEVMLSTDREEVSRRVDYVAVNNPQQNSKDCGCNKMIRTKTPTTNKGERMSQKEKPSGEVMDKVSSLINNSKTNFGKEDRDWMLELNERQLDKLEPLEPQPQEVTREQALQALSADFGDTEKLKDLLPPAVKSQFEMGMKTYKEKRDGLIKTIQTNTGDTWAKEDLEKMDIDTLSRIEKSCRKVDYSGQGGTGGQQFNRNEPDSKEVEVLLPMGFELED